MKGINCFLDEVMGINIIRSRYMEAISKTMLVCVAGPTCSGKTTFGEDLALAYLDDTKQQACLLRMDDWFRDLDDPKLPRIENGAVSFDWPQSYRWSDLRKAVVALVAGREIIYPSYDLASNRRRPIYDRIMRSSKMIIVEGLYAISFCRDLLPKPVNVWAYAPTSTRLRRRLKRDKVYGMDEIEILARVRHAENCFDRFGRVQMCGIDFVVCSDW